jgi:hypothetical protein
MIAQDRLSVRPSVGADAKTAVMGAMNNAADNTASIQTKEEGAGLRPSADRKRGGLTVTGRTRRHGRVNADGSCTRGGDGRSKAPRDIV